MSFRSIAVMLACVGVAMGSPATPVAPAGWRSFSQYFDAACQGDGIVGAGVVLVMDGRIVAHHEYGYADRERGVRTGPRTIYHYGSITKTLTAISVMQLRNQGRLSLDDRITFYIPELRQVHDPYGSMDSITLRMLMSHSAGFQDPTWPYKQGKPWEPFEPTTWNQLVAMMPYQQLEFAPGSRYGYSNPGFIYLARVIEALSGDPWETYVQKNIFNPLGLTHSYFGVTPLYLAADRSHNYTRRNDSGGHEIVADNGADFDPGITIPNGGWNAPLGDLANYLGFLANATHGDTAAGQLYESILPHSTLVEMWQPLHKTSDAESAPNESMGLSFFTAKSGDVTLVGHTGSQAGFLAFMYLNPATGAGIIAALNTDSDLPAANQPNAFHRILDKGLQLIR
ncbi:MAG: serine hydrolase domain-containing protein [Steroidobacterales bacterium]